ncbi:septation protein A [Neptunomonas phycophila]|uniref:septation protein A n=1 Tax=Neptunomonas phycophila TaxID=1572645 RepID=UPI000948BFA4|nr:septation protein A [Neptunomonas phycophila]MDO6467235.1 septation protein A [Neptunomonas phycophila]
MKLLLDFFPIIIFFAVYKYTDDMIIATAVLIPATILQMAYTWLKERRIEKMQLVTLILVIVFGGATVLLQDKTFIQWKPTVVNWLFGLAFLGSHFIGKKPIIERIMAANIDLPQPVWKSLSFAWIGFFFFVGALNLVVAYNFSEDIWVDFKLFGMLGLTVVFIILQSLFLSKHIKNSDQES